MVSSYNPWRLVTSSDSGFLEKLRNVDFLRDLPISHIFRLVEEILHE